LLSDCFDDRPDKKYILIIDEVFDYLDDANTMAAQYYLSQIVKKNQGNIAEWCD
jgi:hypothetical protein